VSDDNVDYDHSMKLLYHIPLRSSDFNSSLYQLTPLCR